MRINNWAIREFLQAVKIRVSSWAVREFLIFGFAAYGALWTVVESFGAFFGNSEPGGILGYAVIVFLSVAFGIWRCWPRSHVELQMPGSDSSIEIIFGDIFEGGSVIVIPVNEYFDGLLGDHVSEKSLHGQFIRNILGGQSDTFDRLTSNALKSVEPVEHVQRDSGRASKYPIGTVAKVDVNDRRFLLAALSKTNIETLTASATAGELWDCLEGIWKAVRDYHNGNLVKVPLVGSGLSRLGLPEKTLIGIILTSFLYHTKSGKIADKVTLVLPNGLRGKIDLATIERTWR